MREGYRRITVRVPAKQFAELQAWTGYGPTKLVREALQAVLGDAERRKAYAEANKPNDAQTDDGQKIF
jgi:hypothetical protein